MRFLGVDPGLLATGYGVIEWEGRSIRLLEGGLIRGRGLGLEAKLLQLHQGILEVLEEFRPEALALEELYSHYRHPRTAILMAHARGVICLAAAEKKVPFFSYAPSQVKEILTGSGGAGKEEVQRAVQLRLHLEEPPHPSHVADALALAICHVQMALGPLARGEGRSQAEGGA